MYMSAMTSGSGFFSSACGFFRSTSSGPTAHAFKIILPRPAKIRSLRRRRRLTVSVFPSFAAPWLVARLDRFRHLGFGGMPTERESDRDTNPNRRAGHRRHRQLG